MESSLWICNNLDCATKLHISSSIPANNTNCKGFIAHSTAANIIIFSIKHCTSWKHAEPLGKNVVQYMCCNLNEYIIYTNPVHVHEEIICLCNDVH